ncbi:hypothetical protein Emtol_0088 (plasmid) [Emticicia oligotrophica DSM 17448]|uniref:Uncharacterized protein n=1 Tax=Emticicia oligotrophica (strain DSM 17448 / CIP 109782 / MTCC 6937 / GPTSA100-15) TaxID=929562 RepID=A0ABM5N7Y4_EMTOG|nr:hypothetical protein Emtol_0088 [Emticicia oligotrophica DSM 17448]
MIFCRSLSFVGSNNLYDVCIGMVPDRISISLPKIVIIVVIKTRIYIFLQVLQGVPRNLLVQKVEKKRVIKPFTTTIA